MNLLHVLSIFVSVLITTRKVTAKSITDVDSRVFYGEDVRPGEHKHLVHLTIVEEINNNTFLCSGSIITDNLIVTAAHCVCDPQISFKVESYLKIGIGYGNTKFSHPNFKSCDQDVITGEEVLFDIGLLQTNNRMIFDSYIQPIQISMSGVKVNDAIMIAGYGETESDKWPNIPKQALVTVGECNIGDNAICSRGLTRTGRGDSGGPVTHNGELVGVTSSGSCSLILGCFTYYTSVKALMDLRIKLPMSLNFNV